VDFAALARLQLSYWIEGSSHPCCMKSAKNTESSAKQSQRRTPIEYRVLDFGGWLVSKLQRNAAQLSRNGGRNGCRFPIV
jgi:hypothetical protein